MSAAHCLVTTYPWMGKSVVAPWFRSASVVTPNAACAWLANGSGSTAAWMVPALSAAAISGSGMLESKCTEFTGTPADASAEATSR